MNPKYAKGGKLLEFTYGSFERAAAAIFRASEDAIRQSDFRARLNLLTRAGVLGPDAKVGKGQRLTYRVEQIERLLCCLELAELGVSPTTAAKVVMDQWANRFAPAFRAAQRTMIHDPGMDDVVLYLSAHVMSSNWAPEAGFPGFPTINHCTLRKLPDKVMDAMGVDGAPRILAVNLSRRLRAFHAALAKSHLDELAGEQPTKGEAKPKRGKK
jgi:hypothetical protein